MVPKSNIGKRLILLVAYLVAGFLIMWFFAVGGEGSLSPAYMFSSWAYIFIRLLYPHGRVFSIICLPAYLAALIWLNSKLSKITNGAIPWASGSIHALGCLIGALMMEPQPYSEASAEWKIVSAIVSAIVVMVYLELDWILARGGTHRAPKGPYWDLRKP